MAEGWTFHSPVRVLFGRGRAVEAAHHATGRVLLVTTRGALHRAPVLAVIDGFETAPVIYDQVTTNPTVGEIGEAIEVAAMAGVDTIVAIGGGSVLDTAKVLSLAVAADEFSLDALAEGSKAWDGVTPRPLVAVPTTAGTGAEVTPFATVWDDETGRKLSVGTPLIRPAVAIVDPDLTASLPWATTLSTGLDALAQCFESVANRNATPITTTLAVRGIRLASASLPRLKEDLSDAEARVGMSEAALLSGLAISHTRTSLAHSMSYPITAHTGLPHGLACALNLPAVLDFMAGAATPALHGTAAAIGAEDARGLGRWLLDLYERLGLPEAIRPHVASVDAIRPYASEMVTPGRADNSLMPVDHADIERILDSTARWFDEGHA